MVDIGRYYSPDRFKSSSFWVLELGDHILGILALDASADATSQCPIGDTEKDTQSNSAAVIRHFWVEEPFRRTDIQDDLLVHALTHALQADPNKRIRELRAEDNQLSPYIGQALRKQGFRPIQDPDQVRNVGVLRWKITPMSLDRERWRAP